MSEHQALVSLGELEKGGMITALGFVMQPGMPFGRFQAICRAVGEAREQINFVMGDLAIAAEAEYGHEGYQALEELAVSPDALQQYARVAERIPRTRRVPGLSWSHHRAVASLEPAVADAYLAEARSRGWAKWQLEEAIRSDRPADPPPGEGTGGNEGAASQYVVEVVAARAERVWNAAQLSDADHYLVPAGPMEELAEALGAKT